MRTQIMVSAELVYTIITLVFLYCRNGVVRFESVMKLRNKLEDLGKLTGINEDEKGEY